MDGYKAISDHSVFPTGVAVLGPLRTAAVSDILGIVTVIPPEAVRGESFVEKAAGLFLDQSNNHQNSISFYGCSQCICLIYMLNMHPRYILSCISNKIFE